MNGLAREDSLGFGKNQLCQLSHLGGEKGRSLLSPKFSKTKKQINK